MKQEREAERKREKLSVECGYEFGHHGLVNEGTRNCTIYFPYGRLCFDNNKTWFQHGSIASSWCVRLQLEVSEGNERRIARAFLWCYKFTKLRVNHAFHQSNHKFGLTIDTEMLYLCRTSTFLRQQIQRTSSEDELPLVLRQGVSDRNSEFLTTVLLLYKK